MGWKINLNGNAAAPAAATSGKAGVEVKNGLRNVPAIMTVTLTRLTNGGSLNIITPSKRHSELGEGEMIKLQINWIGGHSSVCHVSASLLTLADLDTLVSYSLDIDSVEILGTVRL